MNKRYRDVGRCRPGSAALKTHQMSSSLAAQTALGAATNRNRGGKDTLAAYISVLSELLAVSRCHARSGALAIWRSLSGRHTHRRCHQQDPDLYALCEIMTVLYRPGLTLNGAGGQNGVCVCVCVCVSVCQGDIGAGYEDFTQGCIKCLP